MSLVERVHECTRHDLTGRVGLQVEGEVWGHVEPRLAAALGAFPDVFTSTGAGLALRADLDQADSRTGAIGGVVDALYPLGLFGARRGELYPVARQLADPPVFALERGAVGAFGIDVDVVQTEGIWAPDVVKRHWAHALRRWCRIALAGAGHPPPASLDRLCRIAHVDDPIDLVVANMAWGEIIGSTRAMDEFSVAEPAAMHAARVWS